MPFQNTKPQYIINQYKVTMGFSITTPYLPKDKRKRRRIKRRMRQWMQAYKELTERGVEIHGRCRQFER